MAWLTSGGAAGLGVWLHIIRKDRGSEVANHGPRRFLNRSLAHNRRRYSTSHVPLRNRTKVRLHQARARWSDRTPES
ncbi:hypothetical protein [Streptomyces sp. NBC_01361]|uniref:hypothetical protein n=1 Tax=Streptomyces sp. NBC_01361 TaxID=2903838 RepID=UPI002E36C60E|nr:hypothetical protein [Streptomyces sp. NBC_01361]